jgi:hypothetical protein
MLARWERSYVNGHIAARGSDRSTDFDAWSHVRAEGTHKAMVLTYPEAGLLQGAEPYLRAVAQRSAVNRELTRKRRAVLSEWAPPRRRPVRT